MLGLNTSPNGFEGIILAHIVCSAPGIKCILVNGQQNSTRCDLVKLFLVNSQTVNQIQSQCHSCLHCFRCFHFVAAPVNAESTRSTLVKLWSNIFHGNFVLSPNLPPITKSLWDSKSMHRSRPNPSYFRVMFVTSLTKS